LIKEELIGNVINMDMSVVLFIEYSGGDVSIEDLIADENVVITISHIKRTNLTEYKLRIEEELGKKVQEQEIKIS
jgi:DNA gyrase subunit A